MFRLVGLNSIPELQAHIFDELVDAFSACRSDVVCAFVGRIALVPRLSVVLDLEHPVGA